MLSGRWKDWLRSQSVSNKKSALKARRIPAAAAGASNLLTSDSAAPSPGQIGAKGDGRGVFGAGGMRDAVDATRPVLAITIA